MYFFLFISLSIPSLFLKVKKYLYLLNIVENIFPKIFSGVLGNEERLLAK